MVLIRPYRASDLSACRALWVTLTEAHRELYDDPGIGGEDPGLAFDEHLRHPRLAGVWAAEGQAGVSGMVGLLAKGEEAEVEPLVVAPEARGQGMGTALLDYVRAEAQQRGARFLCVRPVARNRAAIRLFVEAGFDKVGQVELFQELFGPGTNEWKDGISLHDYKLRY